LAQTFVETCVDFEVAHLSTVTIQGLPYKSILPYVHVACTLIISHQRDEAANIDFQHPLTDAKFLCLSFQ